METIGDAYMVVSGAPEKEINHAEKVCDMALDMVEAITDLKDPSTGNINFHIRFVLNYSKALIFKLYLHTSMTGVDFYILKPVQN